VSIETVDRQQPSEGTPPRRAPRVRRRLRPKVLISLICGGLLLAVFAYCSLVFGLLAVAQNASEDNDQPRAIAASEWFGRLSPFERHKAHFNVGTAEAKQSDYDTAQPELERALQLTPVHDECAVRQNLAYVYEQQAGEFRQNEDLANANTKFDAARTTLADAPDECRPPGSTQDQQMKQAEERIQESQDEMNAPPDEGSQNDGDSSPGESEGDGSATDSGSEGSQGEDDSDSETESDGDEETEDGSDRESGGTGDGDQSSPGDEKREELRQRQQDSQQRQEESNSRQRSNGAHHDKPW
jgi:tetratricopeptide (TPR) repeat protein